MPDTERSPKNSGAHPETQPPPEPQHPEDAPPPPGKPGENTGVATGVYSRLQVGIILVLVALLAAGLFIFKHRRRLNAQPILITTGNPADYAFRVNVNTAPWQEIALLPGIGETKAKAVVEHRENNGSFTIAADLVKVSGIGEKTVETISDYIVFDE
ncbi:MAG: ComEA family DNA-binding protein [Planctomycetota bacterium]|jgi:comEA protein